MSQLATSTISPNRRNFLVGAALGGFTLAVGLTPFRIAHAYETGGAGMPQGVASDPHLFVSLAPDGTVTIMFSRSEMGQGIQTSLPMIIADEMDADWERVVIKQADGDARYGNQDTDGSRTTRHFLQPLRRCGAMMRLMLRQAAAARWGVPLEAVTTGLHVVENKKAGKSLGYGELAADAMALPTPDIEQVALKEPSEFRYMGSESIPPRNHADIVTGRAIYGQDIWSPQLNYAVVARPPVVGGKVVDFDASQALKTPGVIKVFKLPVNWAPGSKYLPLGGIAVVARNTWAAIKGREALKVKWDLGPNADYNSEAYKKDLQAQVRAAAKPVRNQGDPDKAFAGAARVVSAEYYVPHLDCAPMEPLVATADVRDGKAEIWAPVQYILDARVDAAGILGLPLDKVALHPTLLGGAFGRKSQHDFVQEAALVSKELQGPVKLVWTREDQLHHSFYHSVSCDRIEAALNSTDRVIGWRHRSAAPSLLSTFVPNFDREAFLEIAMGEVDMPFDVPNVRVESGRAPPKTRIGWYRSVANISHAFAVQSFVAELAHTLGRDQKAFLEELIGRDRKIDMSRAGLSEPYWNYADSYKSFPIDTGRLKNVLRIAADAAGYGAKLPKGSGIGLAVHRSFVTYVASAVAVEVTATGQLTIKSVDTAVDCGFVVNPERIRSQVEGSAVMATGNALFGQITFKNGAAEQGNFDGYRVARMNEAPLVVRTHIVPNGPETPAGGIGEPAVPPFAPALLNAIFAATGRRIRQLPVGDQDLTPV